MYLLHHILGGKIEDMAEQLHEEEIKVEQVVNDPGEQYHAKEEMAEEFIEKVIDVVNKTVTNNTEELKKKEDLDKIETKVEALKIDFTRNYFSSKDKDKPDQALYILRNPYEMLVSMQIKQAARKSVVRDESLFTTKAWEKFSESGAKAWFKHARSWICSKVKKLDIIHYENMISDWHAGTRIRTDKKNPRVS